MEKLLKFAGIAGIGYLIFNAISNSIYSRLSFGNTRIRLGSITPQGVNATLTVPITNNNPVTFPLEDLRFLVLYGNNRLSEVVMPQPVDIAANETTELTFNSFLSFADLSSSIVNLIASGQFLQALRIQGTAASSGIIIPFTHTVSVG